MSRTHIPLKAFTELVRNLNSDVKAFKKVNSVYSFCQQVDDWMLLRITEKIIRRIVFEERKRIPG